MKKQHLIIAVACLALIAGLTYWAKVRGQHDTHIIKVGFVSPMTGPFEPYSKEILRGAQLAIDEANQKQESFKLLVEDSKAEPKSALAAFNKLRADGVTYFIGDLLSSSTLAMVPELDAQRVVLICPTGSDEQIVKGSKYSFSIYSSAKDEACFMADSIASSSRTSIAIFYSSNPTAIDMARAARSQVKSNGGQVLFYEEIPKSLSDYESVVAKLPNTAQTMLFGFPNEIPPLMKAATEKGIHTAWILPSTMYDPSAALQLKDITEKIEVVAPKMEGEKTIHDFYPGFALYRDKFGKDPSIWTALGYDAASLITKNQTVNADEFVNSLIGKIHNGISGKISFIESRHAKKELRKVAIVNGKFAE